MASNYFSYLDPPKPFTGIPTDPPAPPSSDDAFFAEIAAQTLASQAPPPPEEAPGLGTRALEAVGSVVGAQKSGVDYLARQAFGGQEGDTTGSMLRRAVGLAPSPEQGYAGALGGRALEFATDVATDPLTYETFGLGKLAAMGIKGAAPLAKAATVGFTGLMGAGAVQEGSHALETIRGEGFTPQAAEQVLGTGLSGLGAVAGAAHLAGGMRPRPTRDPAFERGLKGLVEKGELAPEQAEAALAQEEAPTAPFGPRPGPDPFGPGTPPPGEAPFQPRVAPEPQPAPAPPAVEAAPSPRMPPEAAPVGPTAAPETLLPPPRGRVAAPPPTGAPAASEALPAPTGEPVAYVSPRILHPEQEGGTSLRRQLEELGPQTVPADDPALLGIQRLAEAPVGTPETQRLRLAVEAELDQRYRGSGTGVIAQALDEVQEKRLTPEEAFILARRNRQHLRPKPGEGTPPEQIQGALEASLAELKTIPEPVKAVVAGKQPGEAVTREEIMGAGVGKHSTTRMLRNMEQEGLLEYEEGRGYKVAAPAPAEAPPAPPPEEPLQFASRAPVEASPVPATPLSEPPQPLPPTAEAPRAPGAPQALLEAIGGKGYAPRSLTPKKEYSQRLQTEGKAGARAWLEQEFMAATGSPPEALPQVRRASTQAILETLAEKGPLTASTYSSESIAGKLLRQFPERGEAIEKGIRGLLGDGESAQKIRALPPAEQPAAVERYIRRALRTGTVDEMRRAGREAPLEDVAQQTAKEAVRAFLRGGASLEAIGKQAAEATESAFRSGVPQKMTGMPPEWIEQIREWKHKHDGYAKDVDGRLTPEGKVAVSKRVEDLFQDLMSGFYDKAEDAVQDLAEMSNIASTYARDFKGPRGTPWAKLQETLQASLKRRFGFEYKGSGWEGFAQQFAGELGFGIKKWSSARFTQDPDFVRAFGEERAKQRLAERESTFEESRRDDLSPLGFFSQLKRAVDTIPQAMRGSDLMRFLSDQKRGVKAEELKWTGLDDFLKERAEKRVTKEEVQRFLEQSRVEVREVRKGDKQRRIGTNMQGEPVYSYEARAGAGDTKFSQYQLPGGENYREVLLKLPIQEPNVKGQILDWWWDAYGARLQQERGGTKANIMADVSLSAGNDRITRLGGEWRVPESLRTGTGGFRGGHFDEPNVLAHVRLNDRLVEARPDTPKGYAASLREKYNDANPLDLMTKAEADKWESLGRPDFMDTKERVLFVEEIQSDWAQKGRREGFKTEGDKDAAALARSEQASIAAEMARLDERLDPYTSDPDLAARAEKLAEYGKVTPEVKARLHELAGDLLAARGRERKARGKEGPPEAPFVGKTEAWTELAMKRVMRMAAEEGYDRVAWTTGEQQAARYDLSKHVSEVEYTHGRLVARDLHGSDVLFEDKVPSEKLADYIGKDAAESLMAQEPDSNGTRIIRGESLKVGGEGMKGFYDQIVPSVAGKLGKKWGARVGETKLLPETEPGTHAKLMDATSVHSLDITPQMRSSVMEEGFPQFSKREGRGIMGLLEEAPPDPIWKANTRRYLQEGYEDASLGPVYRIDTDQITGLETRSTTPELVAAFKRGERVPPVVVEPSPDGRFQIVDGTHRVNAAREANVKVPVRIVEYADQAPQVPLSIQLGETGARVRAEAEATPVEGFPGLRILNHSEARTPELDASTASFARESSASIQKLYDRLRTLTGAKGGELGGYTSSSGHEGVFAGGKSYLNPSYHFADALDTAKRYGLEGDVEAVRSIAATRAIATLEHEFLHDLGGHKTEAQFAEALRALRDAAGKDAEFAALERELASSISDATVEQFKRSTPVFERIVEERYAGSRAGAEPRAGALQGAREGGPPPGPRALGGGGERVPPGGEGRGILPGEPPPRGAGRAAPRREGELAFSERTPPPDDGAPKGGAGAEAPPAGGEAPVSGPRARVERAQAKLAEALKAGKGEEAGRAEREVLHARLQETLEAPPEVKPNSSEAKKLAFLKYITSKIKPEELTEKTFTAAVRRGGMVDKQTASELWTAFKDTATKGTDAEWRDLATKAVKFKKWRNLLTIWKANMMGYPTHVTNTASNISLQALRDTEGGVAALLDMVHSGVTGAERTRFVGEAGAAWRGRMRGWQEAWPELKESMKAAARLEAMSPEQLAKKAKDYEDIRLEQFSAPDSKAYEFLTTPLKALGAMDDVAKHLIKGDELHREAYREGVRRGLKGTELSGFERTYGEELMQAWNAEPDTLSPRVRQSIERAASRMAKETLQEELSGDFVGKLGKLVESAKNQVPALELIVPFHRVPTNVIREGLMRTPYGFRKVYRAYRDGKYKTDPGALFDDLAKPVMGTALMSGIISQALAGNVTGQGSPDFRKQQLKQETGWQPYSFKLGDTYVPYSRLEPLASIMGIGADIAEAIKTGDRTSAKEKLKAGITSIQQNFTNKSFLQQFEGAVQAWSDPIRYGEQFAKQLTSSVAPNILGVVPVGTLARALDPTYRKTTAATAPLAKIPGVSRMLPEQRTALGTERERAGGEGLLAGLGRLLLPVQISQVRKDVGARVAGELDRIGFPIQPPKGYIEVKGKRIDLSKGQRERLAEAQLRAVNHMNRMIQDRTYQSLPDTDEDALYGQKSKEYLLKRILDRYRKPVMDELRIRARVGALEASL